jgi:hypothetical protein
MNSEEKKEQKTNDQVSLEEAHAAQMASIWY